MNEFLGLVDQHRLQYRAQELGGEFQIFMHPPGPDYEARRIEQFRPTAEEIAELPEAILKPSRKHFGRDVLWHTEEALHRELLDGNDARRGNGQKVYSSQEDLLSLYRGKHCEKKWNTK